MKFTYSIRVCFVCVFVISFATLQCIPEKLNFTHISNSSGASCDSELRVFSNLHRFEKQICGCCIKLTSPNMLFQMQFRVDIVQSLKFVWFLCKNAIRLHPLPLFLLLALQFSIFNQFYRYLWLVKLNRTICSAKK